VNTPRQGKEKEEIANNRQKAEFLLSKSTTTKRVNEYGIKMKERERILPLHCVRRAVSIPDIGLDMDRVAIFATSRGYSRGVETAVSERAMNRGLSGGEETSVLKVPVTLTKMGRSITCLHDFASTITKCRW